LILLAEFAGELNARTIAAPFIWAHKGREIMFAYIATPPPHIVTIILGASKLS